MGKAAKGSMAQTEVIVDLRKVKELQRLLKAETEGGGCDWRLKKASPTVE